MDDVTKVITAIFGGVLFLAIVSVIIGQKSQAPQVIQAGASALSNVIAAAVNPVTKAATNGNLGASTFTTPTTGRADAGAFNPFDLNPFGSGFIKNPFAK
jgi:hypothetical protein